MTDDLERRSAIDVLAREVIAEIVANAGGPAAERPVGELDDATVRMVRERAGQLAARPPRPQLEAAVRVLSTSADPEFWRGGY